AVEIVRETENSIFTQTISLAAGAAGDRVEIANQIDWQSKSCALKAEFPLTVSNPLATYNWDLGKIERGSNDPKKYEVPSHQWLILRTSPVITAFPFCRRRNTAAINRRMMSCA